MSAAPTCSYQNAAGRSDPSTARHKPSSIKAAPSHIEVALADQGKIVSVLGPVEPCSLCLGAVALKGLRETGSAAFVTWTLENGSIMLQHLVICRWVASRSHGSQLG